MPEVSPAPINCNIELAVVQAMQEYFPDGEYVTK